ncbi:hypothetical protein AArcSl_2280 [Halalkaliarchaeum desulfuricum]|uniref:Uncharacterized protein n=1 Tax=Halalkaliarchaeum desulfuricum TaxID=2055893 RepID=A0A343TLD2_9EURY|nr:hypothetical protein AArcSl_2280 [Halalkaliarchaeum desulfuricum]
MTTGPAEILVRESSGIGGILFRENVFRMDRDPERYETVAGIGTAGRADGSGSRYRGWLVVGVRNGRLAVPRRHTPVPADVAETIVSSSRTEHDRSIEPIVRATARKTPNSSDAAIETGIGRYIKASVELSTQIFPDKRVIATIE